MTSETPTKGPEPRPGPLRSTKTFPRHQVSESTDPLLNSPRRANTFHDGNVPEITVADSGASPALQGTDTFESESNEDPIDPPRASVDMDEIPIELVSMIDK